MGLVIFALAFFTAGISSVIFAFFYNKMYVSHLLESGYRFRDVLSGKSKEEIEQSLGMELNAR